MLMRRNGAVIMWKLIGLVKPLLHIMAITITMGVLGFLSSIFITIFAGFGLLNILGMETMFSNKTIMICLVVFAVIRGILRYAEQASGHYIAFKLLAIIRDHVFGALRKLAPAKLEGKEKGNLISVITTDIELLEVFYAHTIAPIVIAVITSAIMAIFIGRYHVLLAVVAVCSYLIVGLVIPFMNSKFGRETGRKYRKLFGELNSYVLESLRGLKETIQYGAGEDRIKTMTEKSKELDSYQEKLKQKEGATKAVTEAAVLLCSLAMLFTGIHLLMDGAIGFEAVLISTISLMSSFGPVFALSNLSNNLLQTFASGERVLSILEETPIIEEVTDGVDVPEQGNDIKVNNVTFAYKEEKILDDVSLAIKNKEMIGLWGKSGSGKSTLLKLIMRFFDVNNGSITLDSKDKSINVKEVNTSSLRNSISYMTQDTFLFEGTIANNIKLGNPEASYDEMVAAAKKASIHDFILTLPEGYETNINELGANLSGGEKQRIGLARAFMHDGEMLLLDEPTSNLDSLNEAVILKVLKEECKDKTVVLVSHRASTMNVVDRIYKMKQGRVS